jgi:hypothetical protein
MSNSDLRALSILRLRSENTLDSHERVFTPTPIKNKCATLWDKLSETSEEFSTGINRIQSDNQLIFKKHCSELRKFRSYSRLELNRNLHSEQDMLFDVIREENGLPNNLDESDTVDVDNDDDEDDDIDEQIPRVSNPIIFDKRFCKNDKASIRNRDNMLGHLSRAASLDVN